VSPEDFGAFGNGIADDTAAIQAALNYLYSSGGGGVELTSGKTYKVSSKINIPSNCGIFGDGSPTIYATSAGFNNSGVVGTYGANSAVIDLSGETASPYSIGVNKFLTGVKIESQVLDGRAVDGVIARNCKNITISKNEIKNFPVSRCIVVCSVVNGFILDNYIHDCTTNYTGWAPLRPQITGIDVDDDRVNSIESSNLIISGNIISDLTVGASVLAYAGYETDGINLQKCPGTVVSGNRIHNVGEGIDTFASYGNISGNLITNTYNCGIKVIHGASLNNITGNVIRNTGICGILISGSMVSGVGDITKNLISSNTIENINYLGAWAGVTSTSGIKIDNTSDTYTPKNNLICENLIDGSGQYGIITGLSSFGNIYSKNAIYGTPLIARIGGSESIRVTDALRTQFRAHRTTSQTIPNNAVTTIQFNTIGFDSRSEFNVSTYRWTCQIPGVYRVSARVRFPGLAAGIGVTLYVIKNGASVSTSQFASTTLDQSIEFSDLISCNSSDYIEIAYKQLSGVAQVITGDSEFSFFSIEKA
jgi:hypothetical protein